MTPEEIVSQLQHLNRQILASRAIKQDFRAEQLLELMDAAAMRGFQFGSNVAISAVQGALLVQLVRLEGGTRKRVE